MSAPLPLLRLNLGDPGESRIYYCAHVVAAQHGLFVGEGVRVAFLGAQSGGETVRGGQIPAVLSGEADLTVGGPMVAMRMQQEGEARLVSFCAVAAGNPWILAGPVAGAMRAIAGPADLAGLRIIDSARVGTATMIFTALLAQAGLAAGPQAQGPGLGTAAVTLRPGSGDLDRDLALLAAGEADLLLHSLHALAPALAEGRLRHCASLAPMTGPVPWSAYIARPERIAADRPAFAAFTRAIARAQDWMRTAPAAHIAALIAPHYPDHGPEALALALDGYRATGVLAAGPVIPIADFRHFSDLLQRIGWLSAPADPALLLDTDLATEALHRLASA